MKIDIRLTLIMRCVACEFLMCVCVLFVVYVCVCVCVFCVSQEHLARVQINYWTQKPQRWLRHPLKCFDFHYVLTPLPLSLSLSLLLTLSVSLSLSFSLCLSGKSNNCRIFQVQLATWLFNLFRYTLCSNKLCNRVAWCQKIRKFSLVNFLLKSLLIVKIFSWVVYKFQPISSCQFGYTMISLCLSQW